MPRFTCVVACLGRSVKPPPFLAAGGEPLARALRKHSNNNIQVDVDISRLGAPFDLIRSDGTVAVIDLHAAARQLLGNPAQHDRVDKIALLLGDRHNVWRRRDRPTAARRTLHLRPRSRACVQSRAH